MKKIKNNNKGFTLIELLAVIVILAILVIVAIPAVTKYLNAARQGTFADNAHAAISAVRNEVIKSGVGTKDYTLSEINDLLEKKLDTSPFGKKYDTGSYIKVEQTQVNGKTGEYTYTYTMCLADEEGHGFKDVEENSIKDTVVEMSGIKCSDSES